MYTIEIIRDDFSGLYDASHHATNLVRELYGPIGRAVSEGPDVMNDTDCMVILYADTTYEQPWGYHNLLLIGAATGRTSATAANWTPGNSQVSGERITRDVLLLGRDLGILGLFL